MTPQETVSRVLAAPLVPVFYHPDAAYAQAVVRACYAGGVRVFEFTNRGANAYDVFRELASLTAELPELVLGIGTIYTAADAERFVAAGAQFVVQPCVVPEVGAACQRLGVAWMPGTMTLTETHHATLLGAQLIKVFPGNVLGPDYVRALRGPMPDVKLMVTGGVEPTEASLTEWFGAGINAVGIGSQLFKGVSDPAEITARVAPLMRTITTYQ